MQTNAEKMTCVVGAVLSPGKGCHLLNSMWAGASHLALLMGFMRRNGWTGTHLLNIFYSLTILEMKIIYGSRWEFIVLCKLNEHVKG